jgi:hypothetical protein
MKLTLQHHLGNPNMCRIPELTIRQMPECEGGGWWMPREQAEQIVSDCAFAEKCSDEGWDRATVIPAS